MVRLENGHTESVLSVDFSKDNSGHIASGSESGQICLWNENGALIGNLTVRMFFSNCCAIATSFA